MKIIQPRNLGFVRSDHQLPTDLVRDIMVATKGGHLLNPGNSQPRFDRPGLVIKPAMQHTAVMGGLVLTRLGLLFQNGNPGPGKFGRGFESRLQPDNPTTDYADPNRTHVLPD